ncbi:hypothetical protein A9K81_13665 [Pseudomonas syringae pv. syringae]|nr:hypothetical protein A9K81_13665 [Pseudomonas syringae pv. syringae]
MGQIGVSVNNMLYARVRGKAEASSRSESSASVLYVFRRDHAFSRDILEELVGVEELFLSVFLLM